MPDYPQTLAAYYRARITGSDRRPEAAEREQPIGLSPGSGLLDDSGSSSRTRGRPAS